MANREEWLAQVAEEALEPGLPVAEVHHHLWDRRAHSMPARYLIDELTADFAGHNVVATVFNECHSMYRAAGPEALKPVGETEFVNGQAAMAASGTYGPCAVAAGIVGWADLRLGARVDEALEAHAAASPRFRGIRFPTFFHENPAIRAGRSNEPRARALMEPAVLEGIACLARRGLSLEASVFFTQLDEVCELAKRFPSLELVVSHVGMPVLIGPYAGRREEVFGEWRGAIERLAPFKNVAMKLGGLANPRYGFGWQEQERPPTSEEFARATSPWFLACIELLGPGRCMFESNFPVDKASISFNVLYNAYKRMTAGFAPGERAQLFLGTAARVYRL